MTVQVLDHSVDVLRSLLWAHNQAENLQGLLQKKQDWYDENHRDFWGDWLTDVFDLRTANSFGLSVWSVVLALPLFGDSGVSPATYPAFGFDTGESPLATSPIRNFENATNDAPYAGNFATDAQGAFGIPTESKRLLLQLRYFQLVTRGAIPEVNRFLRQLFGENQIYALDGLNMTMTYVIVGGVARQLLSLFQLFDVLPRPAGVRVIFIESSVDAFGFGEFNLNFNNGSFVNQ